MDINRKVKIIVSNDNRVLEGKEGESLLKVLKENGYDVPSLCYHPALKPYGACRLCLVEVEIDGKRKLTTSCDYPLRDGLIVHLDTEKVARNRRLILELLLAKVPENERLKEIAKSFGVENTRFSISKEKNCILCGLCVRGCEEIVKRSAITFSYRGDRRKVEPPFGDLSQCIACGLCEELCPIGFISMKKEKLKEWREKLKGEERICRYSRMGILPLTICGHNFECEFCEIEQRMRLIYKKHPLLEIKERELKNVNS